LIVTVDYFGDVRIGDKKGNVEIVYDETGRLWSIEIKKPTPEQLKKYFNMKLPFTPDVIEYCPVTKDYHIEWKNFIANFENPDFFMEGYLATMKYVDEVVGKKVPFYDTIGFTEYNNEINPYVRIQIDDHTKLHISENIMYSYHDDYEEKHNTLKVKYIGGIFYEFPSYPKNYQPGEPPQSIKKFVKNFRDKSALVFSTYIEDCKYYIIIREPGLNAKFCVFTEVNYSYTIYGAENVSKELYDKLREAFPGIIPYEKLIESLKNPPMKIE
jgi:hypothetical protein